MTPWVLVALCSAAPVLAHSTLPPYIAFWGPFSAAAARCQRQLGSSIGRCVETVLAAEAACLNESAASLPSALPGVSDCSSAAQTALRDAAIAAANSAVQKVCSAVDIGELLFRDLAEAMNDVSVVCSGEPARLLGALAANTAALPRQCEQEMTIAPRRLLRIGLRAKRSALNRIAMHPMTPSQRLARINLAQRDLTRLRTVLARRLESRCPQLQTSLGISAAAWLAQIELRVDCIVFAGYIQSAFRCQ